MVIIKRQNVICEVLKKGSTCQIVTRGDYAKKMLKKLRQNEPAYSYEVLLEMLIRKYREEYESDEYVISDSEELPLDDLLNWSDDKSLKEVITEEAVMAGVCICVVNKIIS